MGNSIELYEKENGAVPVLDFIKTLKPKEQAKIYREIDLLEEFGNQLGFPHVRKIEGERFKGLWELRIKHSSNNFRIFYFTIFKEEYVLLHGFKKKTQKTPRKELLISIERMNAFKRRENR